LKPRLGDQFFAFLASAISSGIDSAEGVVNLAERVLLVLDQAEREFLIVILGSDVRHVEWDVGQVAGGVRLTATKRLVGHLIQVASEPGLEMEQVCAVDPKFFRLQCVGHFDAIPFVISRTLFSKGGAS
jgi:hypothetical protein